MLRGSRKNKYVLAERTRVELVTSRYFCSNGYLIHEELPSALPTELPPSKTYSSPLVGLTGFEPMTSSPERETLSRKTTELQAAKEDDNNKKDE